MIIDGKAIAQQVKDHVRDEVSMLTCKPSFLIIQVGDNDASNVYVRNKLKACEYCGIRAEHLKLDESLTTEEVQWEIVTRQKHYDAVMVQLPLPEHINADRVINAIDPDRDVDGLTDVNVGRLWNGKDGLFPCTALGCVHLLKTVYNSLEGRDVCIVGRSSLVGKPLAQLLQRENCTVTMCHSKSHNIKKKTGYAQIVISAIGKPLFFDWTAFATTDTVIDVGINRDSNNRLCGDVDCYSFDRLNINYTPVPGGVGPMTVAMLMQNVLKAYHTMNYTLEAVRGEH